MTAYPILLVIVVLWASWGIAQLIADIIDDWYNR